MTVFDKIRPLLYVAHESKLGVAYASLQFTLRNLIAHEHKAVHRKCFLGVLGLHLPRKSRRSRSQMGVGGNIWSAFYNESHAIWQSMIATPNYRGVHDW